MHRTTTLAGTGKLRGPQLDFGIVRYQLNILRHGAGGTLACDGGTIVRAWLSKDPVSLELSTGERVDVEITQASFGAGAFLVCGDVSNLRAA